LNKTKEATALFATADYTSKNSKPAHKSTGMLSAAGLAIDSCRRKKEVARIQLESEEESDRRRAATLHFPAFKLSSFGLIMAKAEIDG